jgi:thymidylate synthase (FAD)
MKVVLNAISHPIGIEGVENAEQFIAYAARVSNPEGQVNNLTADKLIRYLIKNKHWSPLEMVSVTMEIETTRDIGRQVLRHRSFSFQEFSQRYASVEAIDESFLVYREARLQDLKNRQNSVNTDDEEIHRLWQDLQNKVGEQAMSAYKEALHMGVAKEQARCVLPEGMTPTRMYMAGTLRSWIHYCDLRCGNGTQYEHKEVADAAFVELGKYFPNVVKAISDARDS